jgi:dihydropteroate synthase
MLNGSGTFIPMLFRARQFVFEFPRPAMVMGIVNVTPDSFSDGGQFLSADKAVAHALALVEQGAEILDVGGESTRPGAEPVSEAEELRRVIPVIEQLVRRTRMPVSIDTVKPGVARAALDAGASIVNDVAAAQRGSGTGVPPVQCDEQAPRNESHDTGRFERLTGQAGRLSHYDDAMWRVVAEAGAGYVCMHMQGTPQTMQTSPHYNDVTVEVGEFFDERLAALAACGVMPEQVALDVGIGFGKTTEHNLQLLAALGSFTRFARPLVLGVSRKSFIGKILAADVAERLPGSLACAALGVEAGVQIIRAHDVAETVQAVRVAEAVSKRRN